MVSSVTSVLLACLAATAHALPAAPAPAAPATSCAPAVLPTVGASGTLPSPGTLKLKKIAVGHGIQNYTCAANGTSAVATGALATLYDITSLSTSLDQQIFNLIPSTILFGQNIPINLANPQAATPGSATKPNAMPESSYVANVNSPFPAAGSAKISIAKPAGYSGKPYPSSFTLPYLGRHYFDGAGVPMFDLAAASLAASVNKAANVTAPAGAPTGIINTAAVPWLQLTDSGKGSSKGLTTVYRVLTDGGSAQPCSTSGSGAVSVPYTAQYWFFNTN